MFDDDCPALNNLDLLGVPATFAGTGCETHFSFNYSICRDWVLPVHPSLGFKGQHKSIVSLLNKLYKFIKIFINLLKYFLIYKILNKFLAEC